MRLIEFQQQKEIPEHLCNKSGLASQVIFSTLFALLFINIYKPFASEKWTSLSSMKEYSQWIDSPIGYMLWSLGIVAIGFFVMVISRTLFYYYAKRHRIFYWVYAIWLTIELSVMALIYTLIGVFAMRGTTGISTGDEAMDFFLKALFYIFSILLIPTMLCFLYMAFMKKKKDLQKLQEKIKESPQATIDQPSVLQFCDEKGEPKFSVKAESVIWIEASDNYVVIKYQNQEKISEFLLRNSLKRLADDFKDTTLFRCHRSYMVNFNHAVALRKGMDGLVIELDIHPLKEIPVSKTYKEETSTAFMQYTCNK
ncbi:MAG: LytTR family transcriptional regulator [Bacteroidales bacterium]|nr:LytTR family transcriptional regulator [Bacteroidales bacterium]